MKSGNYTVAIQLSISKFRRIEKTAIFLRIAMSSHIPHVHVPWHHPHHPPSEKRLLDGVDIANPLHSGYMYKEAHSHLVFHKRFFVLFPGALVYYEKESEYNKDVARGTLEVRHTCSVHAILLDI